MSNSARKGKVAPIEVKMDIKELSRLVEVTHLNILFGAGASARAFALLGDVEKMTVESEGLAHDAKDLGRASALGLLLEASVLPNLCLIGACDGHTATDCKKTECDQVVESYKKFLQAFKKILIKRRNTLLPKQLNVFTTNYDLAFEMAIEEIGLEMNDGFTGKIAPKLNMDDMNNLHFRQGARYGNRSEIPVVNFYKLHGSVAWKQVNKDEMVFDPVLAQLRSLEKEYKHVKAGLEKYRTKSKPCDTNNDHALLFEGSGDDLASFLKKYDELNIVKPETSKWFRTVLEHTYYELLRKFANELEKECSSLFVLGFSFQDEHLKELILRAARTNPTLKVVVFCYNKEALEKIRQQLKQSRIPNDNIELVGPIRKGSEGLTLDEVVETIFSQILPGSPNTSCQGVVGRRIHD